MRYRIFIIIISIFLIIPDKVYSQDPEFTQFYANPLYLNPAFAGSVTCPRLILNYRNQWPSISGTFVTYNASYDQHIDGIDGGLGFLFYHDQAGEGTINTLSGSAIYSYHIDVNRYFAVRTGIQVSFVQKKLDYTKLTFPDMIHSRYGFIYQTQEDFSTYNTPKLYPDFSAGILGYGKDVWIGASVHHLTKPNEAFIANSKLPRKLTIHTGVNIPLGSKTSRRRNKSHSSISPNLLYQQQQYFQQFNYGMYIQKDIFVTGVWFRQSMTNPDALIILFGIQQEKFKVGYSYDLTVSKLTNATGGAHEFSVIMIFPCKKRSPRYRALDCPSF